MLNNNNNLLCYIPDGLLSSYDQVIITTRSLGAEHLVSSLPSYSLKSLCDPHYIKEQQITTLYQYPSNAAQCTCITHVLRVLHVIDVLHVLHVIHLLCTLLIICTLCPSIILSRLMQTVFLF